MAKKISINKEKWKGNKPSDYTIQQLDHISFDGSIKTINEKLNNIRGMSGIAYEGVDAKFKKANEKLEQLCYYINATLEDIEEHIDNPFFERFDNKVGVLEQFEKIRLDSYKTKNKLGIKEHGSVQVYDQMSGTYKSQSYAYEKDSVGFEDLFNNLEVSGPKGMPSFAEMMKEQHEMALKSVEEEFTYEEYVQSLMHRSDIHHTVDKGWLNVASDVLDTIGVVSLVGVFTGSNFITGEILTEAERSQAMFSTVINVGLLVVTVATAGVGSAAYGLKAGVSATTKVVVKTMAVDMISGAAGLATINLLEAAGSPEWLAAIAGLGVSFIGGYYGEKALQRVKGSSGTDFLSGMNAEDAKQYNKYWEELANGTHQLPGMSGEEYAKFMQGLDKVENSLALNKVKYDELLALRNKGASGAEKTLSSIDAEDYAFNAIKGSNKADDVVLGKFKEGSSTSYDAIAKEMDAQYFNLDNWDELSSMYSSDEIWKINEKFLDIQTSSGREIYLSHNPAEFLGDGSYYSKEIQYLIDNGYSFVKEGDIWHAIR